MTQNSFTKGLKKGFEIPLLPDKVNKFYTNIWIRILRVIGGVCAVAGLSHKYLALPIPFRYIVLSLGLFQCILILIMSIIRIIYAIRLIIYNPEIFEVRNSPLDRNATHFAKLLLYWRSGCHTFAVGTSLLGTGLLTDQLIENWRQIRAFITQQIKLAENKVSFDEAIKNTEYVNKIKNSTDDLKHFIDNSKQSNLLSSLSDFKDSFQEYLSHLSLEELACLFNIFGLLAILFAINSITSVYFGDKLLSRFKLEERFPKLAKYIQKRQQLRNYWFIWNLVFIYLVVLTFLFINIKMFITAV